MPSSRVAKIGFLWQAVDTDELMKAYFAALTQTLSGLGYVEGKNVHFIHRFSSGQLAQLRELAKELVDSKPDVILAGTHACAMALKQVTSTIPIVLVLVPNPVGSGLIQSLAHPGGNITGLSLMADDTTSKRLGLFKEIIPTLRRVALLGDPSDASFTLNVSSYSTAAKTVGLELRPVEVSSAEKIAQTFSTIAKSGFDGVVVVGVMAVQERSRVGAAALTEKMPTIGFAAEQVPYGLLMSNLGDREEAVDGGLVAYGLDLAKNEGGRSWQFACGT